jgi:hypothetical protein
MILPQSSLLSGQISLFQNPSEPAPIIGQTLEEPGMDAFKIDFLDEFSEAVRTLLYGLEYQAKRNDLIDETRRASIKTGRAEASARPLIVTG